MADSHVIAALIHKRAEITGQLEHHHEIVRQLTIDLDAVDSVLRMFEPDIELETVKPRPMPPRHAAYKGEIIRIVLTALRTSHHPMTTDELTMRVMTERDMNPADKKLARMVSKRVASCLRHHEIKGIIARNRAPGGRIMWRVAQ